MIKKLGQAFKKMAQRSMLRGNRDDALAVEQHGIYGMRSNFFDKNSSKQANTQAMTSTNSSNRNTNPDLMVKSTKTSDDTTSSVGKSLLDALK